MDSNRWDRVQSLFHAATELPASQQLAYLVEQCPDDALLVDEVLSLLAEDARGDSLLDRGIGEAADRVLSRSDEHRLINERFGPYRITRMLGEGGMGVVYQAERDDLGSVAAVKILRDAWLSPARRERFVSEQRTLAQLNHPFIARLYDAGSLGDGTPWFVMEYVEGTPLTEYCRTHATSIVGRLRLFRNVCEAVQHAHSHLVVHRDLKPSNILVGNDGIVKLLDFGIAKQLDGLEARADRTRTGLRLLTPAYAAPEQIRGGRIGTYTDVHALGVILYELLVGRLPFEPTEHGDELEAVLSDREPERPSIAARKNPASAKGDADGQPLRASEWSELDVLCLTAMNRDPQRRYATVDALVRDIDHFLNGEPLEARPESLQYRLGKFVRRNRETVVAAGLAAALVIGLVAFYTVRLARARNDALAQAARAQRIQKFTLDLFQGGDKAAGPADSLHVVTLLDRGLTQARTLDAEPGVQAELYVTLAGIYQHLGKLARADSLLQLALNRRRTLYGPGSPDVASSLVAIGDLRIDQAQLEDAEKLIRQGVSVAEANLAPTDPGVLHALAELGRVLEERGSYDKAIPIMQDVVRRDTAARVEPVDLAANLSTLADINFYAGHYDVSDSLNRQVLGIYEQTYGARHPQVAEILVNLGASQQERGNYKDAERYDRDALAMTRSFYGDSNPATALDLTMLGRALEFQNRFDEADTVLRQALTIRERVFGPVHPSVASTVNELGNIAYQRTHYDEAEAYFTRNLEIYKKIYGDKHYLIALAISNLATAIAGKKEYARAEQMYREAVRRYTDAQGPNHTNTGIARMKLGHVLLRERRFAEAQVETQAGYDVLVKQASPSLSFLKSARKDLIAEFDTLGKPELAARYRAELADTLPKGKAGKP
jgi:serine/threonine protein kinase/tetratricopeptide (TPR) repeat protein